MWSNDRLFWIKIIKTKLSPIKKKKLRNLNTLTLGVRLRDYNHHHYLFFYFPVPTLRSTLDWQAQNFSTFFRKIGNFGNSEYTRIWETLTNVVCVAVVIPLALMMESNLSSASRCSIEVVRFAELAGDTLKHCENFILFNIFIMNKKVRFYKFCRPIQQN